MEQHRIILSHFQATPLLRVRKKLDVQVESSRDLGFTTEKIIIEKNGVVFCDKEIISWDAVKKISKSKNGCFFWENGRLRKIKTYSELTNRSYSLMPTAKAPTMLVSGFLMHRIKGTDPCLDTMEKIKAIAPVKGQVLDTATGLGYTAIEASKTAQHVITIELDPAAQQIAAQNPWSQKLFQNPEITQMIGDSFDVVDDFDDKAFTRIIHDPPAFGLAGHLYSEVFYCKLYRLLEPRGRLFHYIGNPDSKSGQKITRGVIERLKQANFSKVVRHPKAFGVAAEK